MWVDKEWGCVILNGYPKNGENVLMAQAVHGHPFLEQQRHLYLTRMIWKQWTPGKRVFQNSST
jgi:hypothetical protein